jgi:hypothetical protein
MSDAKRMQLRERVDAGLARQAARENSQLAEIRNRVASAAGEHPLLLIAGGLAIGLAISALIPKSPTRRMSKYAFSGIAMLAELGLAYGKQAFDSVEDAAQEAGRASKHKLSGLKDVLSQLPERTRKEKPVDTDA